MHTSCRAADSACDCDAITPTNWDTAENKGQAEITSIKLLKYEFINQIHRSGSIQKHFLKLKWLLKYVFKHKVMFKNLHQQTLFLKDIHVL